MRKTVFPCLMIAFVLLMSLLLGINALTGSGIRGTASAVVKSLREPDITAWETDVNETLDKNHVFINIFGAIQRLLGKELVEDPAGYPVARLSNGQLTFAGNDVLMEQSENAALVERLGRELAESDIPFLFAIAPTKLTNPAVKMPSGVPDYANVMADALLQKLQGQVNTLDMRPAYMTSGPENSYFFNTDHHWTAQGALLGCGVLMEELGGKFGFQINREALDPASYNVTVYPNLFLGSQGKRVGLYYAGTDDFSVLSPKFETSFSYTYSNLPQPRTGTFDEALCFPQWLNDDYFNGNCYVYYSGGDWGRSEITNLLNPDGPTVVLIRDSLSCALAPFLANQVGKLITIDLRAYPGGLMDELRRLSPDLVLVLYGASCCKSTDSFNFFKLPQ